MQQAKLDHMEHPTLMTPKAEKVAHKNAMARDDGNETVIGSNQHQYPFLAHHERETGESIFLLLSKAKTVLVSNDQQVTARILAAPMNFQITYLSAFSGMKDPAEYTKFW